VRTGRIVAGEGTGRRINAGTWHPRRFITLLLRRWVHTRRRRPPHQNSGNLPRRGSNT
jgi:hypothetical protein